MLLSCPLLSGIQKDPFHHKALLHALGNADPSPAPAGGSKQVSTVLDASLPNPGSSAALPGKVSSDCDSVSDF